MFWNRHEGVIMEWVTLLGLVGKEQDDQAFVNLVSALGEEPQVSMSPLIRDDPDDRTVYKKFLKSGIELGFRARRLNQIHLFVQRHEGYSRFTGEVLDLPAHLWTRDNLVKALGKPNAHGGDKMDGLLGYIRPWLRYEKVGVAFHAEFSQDGRLWKFTLMLE
ncbi:MULTISPECIES: hypothetical protein [Pseudomonas]|uniref:hypothetical protein n=1 Tax=Pseudomonas TaxID=286 RepID=UPI0015964F11|nr:MULTISPECIES: hypothetical protein [Pseudomonas]